MNGARKLSPGTAASQCCHLHKTKKNMVWSYFFFFFFCGTGFFRIFGLIIKLHSNGKQTNLEEVYK